MSTQITPPPPDGQVLSLVGALSNPENHELHVQAIRTRDETLSSSPETYSSLCLQMSYLMAGADRPADMIRLMDSSHLDHFKQNDPTTATKLHRNEALWTPFGQMAGLILKQALLHPPLFQGVRSLHMIPPAADQLKEVLLYCLGCTHEALRNVASTVIATTAVSDDSLQPALNLTSWPQLIPALLANLQQTSNIPLVEGSLSTIRKIMEDGPHQLRQDQLDSLVPVLLRFLSSSTERTKLFALQSLEACLSDGLMPSALVALFETYLGGLSSLAVDPSPKVRKWVCRSIVTLLQLRSEYLQPHMEAICQFMLTSTADTSHPEVALEACEFWLAFASLEDDACTPDMVARVGGILNQLIPILLRGMVYLPEQQEELLYRNELEMQQGAITQSNKPIFHKGKAKRGATDDDDDDDNNDDFDDDEGNSWTLRKCSAASLDSLSSMYGAEVILPPLLPGLQEGLASTDVWVQEASILALGAVSDGCSETMATHMGELHPYLMGHLAAPEGPNTLPQIKSIAAWTLGRYSSWVVEQVQSGTQGHLLAQMAEIFLSRLNDKNQKVQVSCCSAFGVLIENAGDLVIPYLEPILQGLVSALSRFEGKPRLIALDTFGILADFVGPAIGEGNFPAMFIPHLLQMWDGLAKMDPSDRTILPLLESLASIVLVCGANYQPYALETFEKSMVMIETMVLELATGDPVENDEDADAIVCAADVLDGLVEGMASSFPNLLASSERFGPLFMNVTLLLTRYEVPGVRMSAYALIGDLARNAPMVLEQALPEILRGANSNLSPVHPSVCNNAIWAIGEICVKCKGNPAPLEPFAKDLVQKLVELLMSSGFESIETAASGLVENAATTAGRLALVNPSFIAFDLPRFLIGWCDGIAKISDPMERRDACEGFIQSMYANPSAIHSAAANPEDAISAILFAVVSWHLPEDFDPNSMSQVQYQPFPPTEMELGNALKKLLQDIKTSVGEETWRNVEKRMPVNVRQLLRDSCQI